MAWTAADALIELRTLLSDGPQDKRVHQKRVLGIIDGTNRAFKTFETRIVSGTLAVTVDAVAVPSVTLSDAVTGDFTIDPPAPAPAAGSVVRASYYWRHFLDAEIDTLLGFLRQGARMVGVDDPLTLSDLLKPSVLQYAASFAYQRLAVRWMEDRSGEYLMEDAPGDGVRARLETFQSLAASAMERGNRLRESVHTRFGQREVPVIAVSRGAIPEYTPLR